MFWWRKDEQLEARLSDVVETCERTRQSITQKPARVTIDTSFIDQPAVAAEHPEHEMTPAEYVMAQAEHEVIHEVLDDRYQDNADQGIGLAEPAEAPQASAADQECDLSPTKNGAQSLEMALLELAVAKNEIAQKNEADALEREAAARLEVDTQLDLIHRLEAKVAEVESALLEADETRDVALKSAELSEQKLSVLNAAEKQHANAAQNVAQALEHEAAARLDADQQRANAQHLEVQVAEVEAAKHNAEAGRDDALNAVAQIEQKLSVLSAAAKNHSDAAQSEADALEREAVARLDADEQRANALRLETQVAEVEAAKHDAEAGRDDALNAVAQIEQKLSVLSAAAKNNSDAAQNEAKALEREAVALKDADEQRANAQRLQTQVADVEAAKHDAETGRDNALNAVAQIEQKLSALSAAAKNHSDAAQNEANALEREAVARLDADEQRANAQRLETQVAEVEAARHDAETLRDDALSAAEQTQKRIDALSAIAKQQDDAELNEADAVEREAAARKDADGFRAQTEHLETRIAEIEAQRDDALKSVERTEHKLSAITAAAKTNSDAAKNDTEIAECETAARLDADEQRANTARLEAQVAEVETAKFNAETQRDDALKTVEQTEQKLVALTTTVEHYKQAAQSSTETDQLQSTPKQPEPDPDVEPKTDSDPPIDTATEAVYPATEAGHPATEAGHPATEAGPKPGATAAKAKPLSARLTGKAQLETPKQPATDSETTTSEETGSGSTVKGNASVEALREATDKPLIFDPADYKPDEKNQDDITSAQVRDKQERREKRIVSHLPASFLKEDSTNARSCTILDKSSSGARLEIKADTYNKSMGELSAGDKLTLSFGSVREQTSVICTVAWVSDKQCGVKYSGQFVTQDKRIRKSKGSAANDKTSRFSKTKASGRRSIF